MTLCSESFPGSSGFQEKVLHPGSPLGLLCPLCRLPQGLSHALSRALARPVSSHWDALLFDRRSPAHLSSLTLHPEEASLDASRLGWLSSSRPHIAWLLPSPAHCSDSTCRLRSLKTVSVSPSPPIGSAKAHNITDVRKCL